MTSRSLQLLRTFTSTSVSAAIFTPSRPTITTIKRNFSRTSAIMGVTKTVLKEGSGRVPVNGDQVTIEYTGFLKDTTKPDNKGAKFDSSVDRGPFVVSIGVGQVIRGWDEGVTTMKQGEKATLDITSDFGYGNRGFPGVIPAGSDLIFDVELLKVGK